MRPGLARHRRFERDAIVRAGLRRRQGKGGVSAGVAAKAPRAAGDDHANPLAVGPIFAASFRAPPPHPATRAVQPAPPLFPMMRPRLFRPGGVFAALFVVVASLVSAQPAAPRPLTHEDFDAWRSFFTPTLSRDGRWLAYSAMPQDGDGDLVIREIATGTERRVPVGMLLPPAPSTGEESTNPEAPPVAKNIRLVFTSDSRFVVASTHPTKAEIAQARKDKKKPEDSPKNGLVIVNLAAAETIRVPAVKSFQVPPRGGAWLAYLKEPKPEPAKTDEPKSTETPPEETREDDDRDDAQATTQRRPSGPAPAAGAPKKEFGTELVLRDLAAGSQRSFENALDCSFARDGQTLLYTVSSKAETDNGLYAVTPGTAAAPASLLTGKGKYTKLTWDRTQAQAVIVSDRDDAAAKQPKSKPYLWTRGTAAAVEIGRATTAGPAEGLVFSDKGPLAFSRDGQKLFLPAAPPPKPPRSAASAPPDEEKVTADLWRWNDDYVQPIQKVRAARERTRTYAGILDLATRHYTQLADSALATVTLSDDGRRALGSDDRAYRKLTDFDGRYADFALVDPATGTRRTVLKQQRSEGAPPQWSPDGQWAAYYQDKHWHVLNTADGTTRRLTAALRVSLHNEDHDLPAPPAAYGSAGWTKDSASLLVYDRYDVWQVFPNGRAALNLTAGHGRATQVALRVQRTEPVEEDDDERGIDPAKPLVLRGESEETRATGFFRTDFAAAAKKTAPQRLLWDDKNFRYIGRAQDADVLLVTAGRFDTFPDVHTTDASFGKLARVTDGAAQQKPFLWGRSELVKFKGLGGQPLQAALYQPANFDPKKKYPMIVYIYERLAQNVHEFVTPRPSQNVNFSLYTSHGYLVLAPDIVYQTGQPGQSALQCVLPAVDAVVQRGCVDENAIGIQGHSWGGYQIAYLVTQTNRFRAAEAGAPVGNMTSAYSGIRWGTGLPRQFQYEQTQSRIGQSLQAAPQLYLANSPVFRIENVRTPLLLLHNDGDDAVPWQQGIELFLALRRHDKPAWLFNYNGQPHGLRRRADQKDFGQRMHQFFDHFLKGSPAPEWMDKGIPYLERDEEKVKFNARN